MSGTVSYRTLVTIMKIVGPMSLATFEVQEIYTCILCTEGQRAFSDM